MPRRTHSPDASAVSSHAVSKAPDAALKGWLMKRSSRARHWNDRYFVLDGDVISYYDKPDDSKPKASLVISHEAGCEVGSIFIDQRQKGSKKELLYCLKVTWSSIEPVPKDESQEAALPAGDVTPTYSTISPVHEETESLNEARPTSADSEKRSQLRRRKPSSKSKEEGLRTPSTFPVSRRLKRAGSGNFSHQRSHSFQNTPHSSGVNGDQTESPPVTSPKPQRSTKTGGGRTRKDVHWTLRHSDSLQSTAHSLPVHDDEIESPPKRLHRRSISDGDFLAIHNSPAKAALRNDRRGTSVQGPEPACTDKLEQQPWHQIAVQQYQHQLMNEQQLMQSLYYETKRENRRRAKKQIVTGSKVAVAAGAAITVGVLTAGMGLVAGLMALGVGAAAGGTGIAAGAGYSQIRKKRHAEITMGTPNYELSRQWKDALDACLVSENLTESTWGQMFLREGRNKKSAVLPTSVGLAMSVRSPDSVEEWTSFREEAAQHFVDPETRWRPMEGGWASLLGSGAHGLRIFREERSAPQQDHRARLSVEGRPSPPLKGQIVLNASPLDAFMCLMTLPRVPPSAGLLHPLVPNSGQRASFRLIESIDENMDIIHLVFYPLYLFPTWTSPRDFVLFRYWRLESDGTYVVCYKSVQHPACPPHPGYTRGEMNGVYTISPRKKKDTAKSFGVPQECLLTAVVQVDPRGWVINKPVPFLANQGYGEAFSVSALLQVLDIRDALDEDRFVPVDTDIQRHKPLPDPTDFGLPSPAGQRTEQNDLIISPSVSIDMEDNDPNYDFKFSEREITFTSGVKNDITRNPLPLPPELWAEPDSNSFRVRGKFYKTDKRKINAGSSIGKLIAVDVVTVEKPIFSGFCNHPTERVQRALERERKRKEKGLESDMPPFLFVVNIILPGPPVYHGVFYYAVDDMSSIDGTDGTPSSALCKKFLFGDSDDFRDKTFKMIPQIVEGNFLVRKAVGNTPAIMGTKLRQYYARSDRFCEVILDCGSSSVATGVIRLSLGYARELVVDLGFLLEGKEESLLPERIFGSSRIKKLHFGPHLRLVEQPPEAITPTQ